MKDTNSMYKKEVTNGTSKIRGQKHLVWIFEQYDNGSVGNRSAEDIYY